MRKILIVIVFLIILLLASIYGGNTTINQSATYEIDEVNEIVVNMNKADVNFITTEIDKVQVEISSNALTQNDEYYFSYVEEGVLYVQNFVKDESYLLNPRTKINIYVPIESNVDQVSVKINQGSISLDNMQLTNANLQGHDVSINVVDSVIDKLNIGTAFGKVNIKNTNSLDVIINTTRSSIEIEHLLSNTISINSSEKANIKFVDSVVSMFKTSGENINMDVSLYDSYDYVINSDETFSNPNFAVNGETYTYDIENQEGEAVFYLVNTTINNIEFITKQ